MIDAQATLDNLEQNIRWIEDIECHQFPGWANVTGAMREAMQVIRALQTQMEELAEDR